MFFVAAASYAAVIDRIAVSVGNQVITLRDIEREIRVTAFLDSAKPDLSASNKRAMAERMVDETLIRREMETSHFPAPPVSEIQPAIEKLKKTFPAEADYQHALAQYGIAEADVQDILLRMRTLEEFIGLRFRPAVQVTDREIQDYFDNVVAPAARAAHPGETPLLQTYRAEIEEKLGGARADRELENWLAETRKRTDIVFHPEAFA